MNVYAYAASVICAIVIGGCLWELISSLIDWIKNRKVVGYVSAVCVCAGQRRRNGKLRERGTRAADRRNDRRNQKVLRRM